MPAPPKKKIEFFLKDPPELDCESRLPPKSRQCFSCLHTWSSMGRFTSMASIYLCSWIVGVRLAPTTYGIQPPPSSALGAVLAAEAAGDFHLDLHHAAVAFGLIVS